MLNYEKFLNKSYGEHLKHVVSMEKMASTSLGIQGWALADFGQGENVEEEIAMHAFYRHDIEASDDWDSEAELSDLEPFPEALFEEEDQ